MDLVLAFDLGGTSFKGALISPHGEVIALERAPLTSPLVDQRGYSEMDPEEWYEGLVGLTGKLLSGVSGAEFTVIGISICGLTRTQVFLDARGKSIRPAISWADGRAADQAERIALLAEQLGSRGRTFGPVNAYHTLARLFWLKDEEPESFKKVHRVLEPKDFLNFRLTGRAGGDNISLSRLLLTADGNICHELMAALDLPSGIFPPLQAPDDQLGSVVKDLPPPLNQLAGVPVFTGGMDAWCACLGTGAIRNGRAYNVSGASEVLGLVVDEFREIPGLVSLPWGEGLYQVGGPSQSGADCLTWILEMLLGDRAPRSPEVMEAILSDLLSHPRRPEPILFLPYLRGERTPLWEPDARGVFWGVNRGHGPADFVWSVMEGVAMANRRVFELAGGARTGPGDEVRVSGGAARSDVWLRIKADVLRRPVVRTLSEEAGLLGSAITALTGLGRYADLTDAQQALVRVDRVFEPRREASEKYDIMYRHWLKAQEAMVPLTRDLTAEHIDMSGME